MNPLEPSEFCALRIENNEIHSELHCFFESNVENLKKNEENVDFVFKNVTKIPSPGKNGFSEFLAQN